MKYKKHIVTGALAISLLVGGSSVFASTPRDLGIKKAERIFQKHDKNEGTRSRGKRKTVGTIASISNAGFMVEIKNRKTEVVSSVDVKTGDTTLYSKNGISANESDLSVGQKVKVAGNYDKATNIMTAKAVKIVTGSPNVHKVKKVTQ